MRRAPVIAVIGSGAEDTTARDLARRVGRVIGAEGCHLICGGRGGVMEAACRGHHEGRQRAERPGVTIGLLPGYDGSEANSYVDVALPTGVGLSRNAIVASSAEAVVAVAGGSGTLSEIAFAWQLGRPIAALGGAGGWAKKLAGQSLDGKRSDSIIDAATPEEAISRLLGVLRAKT